MIFTKIELLRLCDRAAGRCPCIVHSGYFEFKYNKNNTKLGRAWCCYGGGDGGRWC